LPKSIESIGTRAFDGCTGITSINCDSPIPLNLDASPWVFAKVNTTTCTLYVPSGSKSLYQAATQWKDFTNIIETTTGLQSQLTETLRVYPNPVKDELFVEVDGKCKFTIINLMGQVIYTSDLINSASVQMSNLPPGVYSANFQKDKSRVVKKFIKE